MIGKLKPYPAMKDSGLPWAGEIPAHWDLVPNRTILRRRKFLVGKRHSDYELLSLTKAGVIVRDISTMRGKFSADMSTSQEVRVGDLVFCLFDVPETPRTVGLSKHNGMITGAYTVLECRDSQLVRFVEAFYIAMDDRKLLSPLYSGLRNTISPSTFLGIKTPVPPSPEQVTIIRFLYHYDRKIRRYIRVKQKLIKLLEEEKQAIIHCAVTRGLPSTGSGQAANVRLKPSGVEWLREIPEHWEVRRLKTLVRHIDQGVSPQAENYPAEGEAWGVLKAGCVNRGVFRENEHKRLPTGFLFDPNLTVSVGDVLISRASGSPHYVGSAGRISSLRYKLILSDKTFRPAFNYDVDPDFMVLVMNSRYYRCQVEQAISGAEGLANNLPLSSLRGFVFIIAPLVEQQQIVTEVERLTKGLHMTIVRTEREISFLREYRTRLIADVVTGKLDVREAAARLPEESEEPELMEDIEEQADREGETEEVDMAMTSEEASIAD